jgi:ADP-heptose:LPS heptosyltransferase
MKYEAHSILALDASPFGRSLDLVPTVNSIRSACPGAYIAVAASAGTCELLASLRLADKTISLGPIKPSDKGIGSGMLRVMRLSRSVGKDEIDLVLDFSPGFATLLYSLTRRARIITPRPSRARWSGPEPGTRSSKRPAGAEAYTSILGQLDMNNDISNWSHLPAPQESARFEEYLARSGFKGGEPILLLHTMEAGWSRSWPVRCFAELALRLSANYGVRVVAADAPSTGDFTNSIAVSLPREAIKLRSPRAVEFVAAVARSSLVVTDDSGVARMSRGLGTPTLDLGTQAGVAGSASARVNREIESVYQEACRMLQTSRTGALFK